MDVDGRFRRRVLHVAEAGGHSATPMAKALASTGAELVAVPDVYRALARLVKAPRAGCDAVVVCVDGMDAAEGEFFSLVTGLRSAVPVLVYGRAGHAGLLAEAVARGATEIRDPAAVSAMIERRVGGAAPATAPPAGLAEAPAPPITEPAPGFDARVAAPGDTPIQPQTEPTRPAPHAEESTAECAEPSPESEDRPPVPWAPTSKRPQRRAPGSAASPDAMEQPLLTEEELHALLGGQSPDGETARPGEGEYPL